MRYNMVIKIAMTGFEPVGAFCTKEVKT